MSLSHLSISYRITGCRIAQVRVVFRLPPLVSDTLFDADVTKPKHLAYVEWFSKFSASPDINNGMFKIERSMIGTKRLSSIVEVADIRRSIHLFPKMGHKRPIHWTTNNVLDHCSTFYVNDFTDRHSHLTIY